ncbi:MAG: ABC transporter ATP-binding protein [Deltaproteobacteria bacterium]|nr:MAG: ABC transporter ATP-binding protein [Deltaproteobacteria bacterium]
MLLEIIDLNVRYGGAVVLSGISLKAKQGEIVTIIGNNGAGKTTTLRTISGLKRPISGEILFQGIKIHGTPAQDIVKMGIGHVPQGRDLFPYMGVLENIRLGAYLQKDKDQTKQNLETIFHTFPVLKVRKRQQAATLSGGEQQMLAIARALMGNPTLLLLDEPSTGLAPIMVREIGKIAVEINQMGTSILLVEQNARLALRLSHRGYVLETGQLVLQGKSKDLLDDERVKKAYLGQE